MLIAGGGPAGMMLRIRSPAQEYTWSAAAPVASGSRATSKLLAAAPNPPPAKAPQSPGANGVVFTHQVDRLSPSRTLAPVIVRIHPPCATDPAWQPKVYQSREPAFGGDLWWRFRRHGTDHDPEPLPSFPRLYL